MNQPTTRRQFLKQVAAACAGIGAVGVVAPSVGGKTNRSVQWGKTTIDYPKGLVMVDISKSWFVGDWTYGRGLVIVKCLEPIKAGQILVWNPDGTVRGA